MCPEKTGGDFYRVSCERLRRRNLELLDHLTREQLATRRSRAMTTLFREAHLSAASADEALQAVAERFLRVILDLLYGDRAAFLQYDSSTNRFLRGYTLGFPGEVRPDFAGARKPVEFLVVTSETPPDPVVDALRDAAGVPCLIWAFLPPASMGLLLGISEERAHVRRVFDADDQEIITCALRVFADLIERREARQVLRQIRERLELALHGADLGMWDWNLESNEVFFDRRWKEMLGYGWEEIKPHFSSWADLVNPEDFPRVNRILEAHLAGRSDVYEAEHRLRTKDGDWKWILARGKVVARDPKGRPLRMAGTHLDISDRKRAEEELLQFKTMADRANYGTAILDPDWNLLYLNDHFARMHGYEPEELLGRNVAAFHSEDQMPGVTRCIRQLVDEGTIANQEIWHVRRNGTKFPTLMNWVAIRDGKDCPVYAAATAIEISDRKEAEAVLTRALNRLEKSHGNMLSILNELSQGTAFLDSKGRITFLSKAGERMVGIEPSAVLRNPWDAVLPFEKKYKEQLRQMIERPACERRRICVARESSDGSRLWLDVEVKDDPRDPNCRILFLYDTSELHDLRKLLDKKVSFFDIIGKSKEIQAVFEHIRQLCRVDTTVLIEGETGTGKELVARALHFASHRKGKPFVTVNCCGLAESMLQSQLFGHRRGAFTGAVQDHRGVFEDANEGTVFLDEISGISPGVQAALLRVLDKKEVTPLGESTPRVVDVRIIAASNRNLAREVEEGRFRADLLYRIRVARIEIPPLRNRKEDIPLLADTFLRQCSAMTGKRLEDFSPEAVICLRQHAWPGNVRELKNAVEFAALQCKRSTIRLEDLPPEVVACGEGVCAAGSAQSHGNCDLMSALKQAEGNRSKAARILGISRATFYRRMAKIGFDLGSE